VIEIGTWKHEVTDLNTLLCNFETNATASAVTGEMKALELTRCLEEAALELIQSFTRRKTRLRSYYACFAAKIPMYRGVL